MCQSYFCMGFHLLENEEHLPMRLSSSVFKALITADILLGNTIILIDTTNPSNINQYVGRYFPSIPALKNCTAVLLLMGSKNGP